MTFLGAALFAAVAAIGHPPAPAFRLGPDPWSAPGLDVPFLPQEPLLCGGAAAAMVAHYLGLKSVYPEDFAHLVRKREGGIRADDLKRSLDALGLRARESAGVPTVVDTALERGTPPILLVDGGRAGLHYVVLVELAADSVWIHDPNLGPHRGWSRKDFMQRWASSGFWALLVTRPTVDPGPPRPGGAVLGSEPLSPRGAKALDMLRSGDYRGAASEGEALLADGRTEEGLRILATARYLDGRTVAALEAWNRLGEPEIDLVEIRGARRVRYQALHGRTGLQRGRTLTPSGLATAGRRLRAHPSVERARLTYRPERDGSVEVVAAVQEAPPYPSRIGLAGAAFRAVVSRRATLSVGPFLPAGERWSVSAGVEPARTSAALTVRSPVAPLPGIAAVTLDWAREDFVAGPEERLRGSLGLSEWTGPDTRLGGTLSLERWAGQGRAVGADLAVTRTTPGDRAWVSMELGAATGPSNGHAHARAEAVALVRRGSHRLWRGRIFLAGVTDAAPRMTWPGAGPGRLRGGLLRGHPSTLNGFMNEATLGRALANATVEHLWFKDVGAFRGGMLLFVDAARVGRRSPGVVSASHASFAAASYLDVGGGLLLADGPREITVTLGWSGDGWMLSSRIAQWAP